MLQPSDQLDRWPTSRRRSARSSPPSSSSASSSPSWSTCARAGPRSAPRSSSPPTASPYTPDEELETKKLDRTLGFGLVLLVRHRRRAAALLAGRARPPGRRGARASRRPSSTGARRSTSTAPSARTATAPRASAVSPTTPSPIPPPATSSPRCSWQAPALDTRDVPLHARGGALHPELRPRLLADAGVGRSRRWSAHRAAARRHHRLPRRRSSSRPRSPRPRCREELDDDLRAPTTRASAPPRTPSTRRSARPCSTSATPPKFAGGAYSCGRCHTKGWSYGQAQVAGGGVHGPEPDRWLRDPPVPDRRRPGATSSPAYPKAGHGLRLERPVQRPAWARLRGQPERHRPRTADRMIADQVMLTQEQIAAVVDYERSL